MRERPFSCVRLQEEDKRVQDEHRDEDGAGPTHITEKAGHFNAVLFGNCLDHEVRCIADVCIGTHEDGTGRNGEEHVLRNRADCRGDADGRTESAGCLHEDEIRRRVVEEGRKESRRPEELPRFGQTELAAVDFKEDEGRNHGDENAHEENRHFDNRRVREFVQFARRVFCRF